MSKALNITRLITLLFFMALLAGWVYNGRLSSLPYVLIPVSIFTVAIFVKSKVLDKAIGYVMATGSAYMLIAVSSHLPKVERVTEKTIKFFGFGYGIFGLCFIAALFLFYYHGKAGSTHPKEVL